MAAQRKRRAHGEGMAKRLRGERTKNMPSMSVTLDVSKLSGWLNVDAACAESKGADAGRDAGREAASGA